MAIHIDVLVELRELELRRVTRRLKNEAERIGEDMSDLISKGFKQDSRKVVKSLNTETDAMVKLRRATDNYTKVMKNGKATREQQTRAMEDLARAVRGVDDATKGFTETSEREMKLAKQRAKVINGNAKAFRGFRKEMDQQRASVAKLRTDNQAFIQSNSTLARNFDKVTEASKKASREHKKYNRMVKEGTASRETLIRQGQVVRDAYDKERRAITDVTDATVQNNAATRERIRLVGDDINAFAKLRTEIDKNRTGIQGLRTANTDLIKDNASLTRSFDRVSDATAKTVREQNKYNRMVIDGTGNRETLIRQSNAVRDAYEKERRAIRDATDAMSRHNGVMSDGSGGGGGGKKKPYFDRVRWDNDLQGLVGSLLGLRAAGGVGMIALAGIAAGAVEVAKMAVTLSQSLWLIPAGATAAGAALGTLKLATSGFGDTISALVEGDLEKFALQINKLSPNAQQAALSIQAILPAFENLRKSVQDSFFDGLGGELERLSATYMPMIEGLTTGIAGAFNAALKGVSMELVEPDTQATMQTMFDNISLAFQNLAPAARSLSQAFIDIASVGSEFLPDLATGASDLAAEFAAFIREARESGNLKRWIEEGLAAVKELGSAISYLGQLIYDVFGRDAKQNVADFKSTMDNIAVGIQVLRGDFSGLGEVIRNDFLNVLFGDKTKAGIRDFFVDIPEAAGAFGSKMIEVLSAIGQAINNMLIKPLNVVQAFMTNPIKAAKDLASGDFKGAIPEIPEFSYSPNWGDWGPATDPRLRERESSFGRTGETPFRDDTRRPQWGTPAPQTQRPVPEGPMLGPDGKPLSDSERRAAIEAGLNPSEYAVDPYAPLPGPGAVPISPPGSSPTAPPRNGPPPGAGPYSGYYEVDPQQVLEADRRVQSEAKDLEEAIRKRMVLERDNQATAADLEDAKWKEVEAGWRLQEAQAKLAEEQQGTWKKLTDGLEGFRSKLSAGLDADLGISKGLPGLADNLVRFLGTLAAAPLLSQLEIISEAQGGIERTGSGLIGMAAARGAFGPQFTPEGMMLAEMQANGLVPSGTTSTGLPVASPYTGATSTGATGSYPGDAALLAHLPPGGTYDNSVKDLSRGLIDCASGVEDLVNIMDGKSTVGGSLWTGNAAEVLPQMGFLPGMGGPGDFRIGYNSGHMQATLPGGTNVNFGSTPAIQAGGLDGGAGAFDPSFTDHWYRPVGATGGPAGPATAVPRGGASLNTPFGSIPIPLPVTIVNGGGTVPAPGGPRSPGGKNGAPGGGGGGGGTPGADWDAIARKESGGQWNLPWGDADSTGGLQIQKRTWDNYNGPALTGAEFPYQASKEDQIRIAELILADQGPRAWANGKNFVPWGGGAPDTFNPAAPPVPHGPPATPPGLFSPENTNPALNNPPAPRGYASGGPVWGDPNFDRRQERFMNASDRLSQQQTGAGAWANFGGVRPFEWGLGKGNFDPRMMIDTSTTTSIGNRPAKWWDPAVAKMNMYGQSMSNLLTGVETDAFRGDSYGPGALGFGKRLWNRWGPRTYGGGGDHTFAPPPKHFNNNLYTNMIMGYGAGAASSKLGMGIGRGFARGGANTDTVPAMLTPGEHVLTRGDVAAMGGHAGVYAFRSMLHMAGGGGVPKIAPPPILPPAPPKPVVAPPKPVAPASPPGSAPGAPLGKTPLAPGATLGKAPSPPGAPPQGATKIGGGEPVHIGGGGAGQGGLAGTLTAAGAMAADMFAPGSGAAVQVASQLIQRAIKFGSQAAGIGAQGLMETFLPFGGSDLANNNWITRIGGAFAGVAPQIPNIAGKSASVDQMMQQWQPSEPMSSQYLDRQLRPPPPPPPPVSSGQGTGPPPGPQVHTTNVFNIEPSTKMLQTLGGIQAEAYQTAGQR